VGCNCAQTVIVTQRAIAGLPAREQIGDLRSSGEYVVTYSRGDPDEAGAGFEGGWLKLFRERRRYLWGLLLVPIALAGLFTFYRRQPDSLVVAPRQVTLPADGREHAALTLQRPSSDGLSVNAFSAMTPGLRFVPDGRGSAQGWIKAPVMPAESIIQFTWHDRKFSVPAHFAFDGTDSYGDGTPDFLRLHSSEDQQAFRTWFTALAEAQALQPAETLPREIDDCAALLRYSYREALSSHDEKWLAAEHGFVSSPTRSVQQYHFPFTPLGASLFRVRPGTFLAADISDGSFAQFADAHTLMLLNAHLVGRDIRRARKGDLLFYRLLEQNSPYHSMIILDDDASWVVYHTGPIRDARGEVRRVSTEDLLHHPDVRWRPLPENSNFLGVYRWNILRDAE
jgi:uncharacterized protein